MATFLCDLFWRSLEGDILLLAHVRGIRIWLVVQLVAFNFLFVFLPYSMRFARTGASPQRGYLEYLLARDAAGGERELSLQKEVAYIQAEGGRRRVFTAGPGSVALHIGHALSDLEQQVDPELYFLLNRNFLVHRDAIRDWKDEPGGRRVMVWLNPAVAGCPRRGGAPRETCVWVSKEKAGPFREWYAMGRTG